MHSTLCHTALKGQQSDLSATESFNPASLHFGLQDVAVMIKCLIVLLEDNKRSEIWGAFQ